MKDLHPLFINPFDDVHISFDELKSFTTDHIQRMTANPQSALTPRVAPTSTALTAFSGTLTADDTQLGQRKGSKLNKNTFRDTLPAAISKIAMAVEAQFNEGSAEFLECFPYGRSEFSNCKDDKLENALQTLINGVTAHQPPLAATVVTSATALLAGWLAVYAPSETATGGKTSTQSAKKAARAALSLELFKNLLTMVQQFPGQPGAVGPVYAAKPAGTAHAHAARAVAGGPGGGARCQRDVDGQQWRPDADLLASLGARQRRHDVVGFRRHADEPFSRAGRGYCARRRDVVAGEVLRGGWRREPVHALQQCHLLRPGVGVKLGKKAGTTNCSG